MIGTRRPAPPAIRPQPDLAICPHCGRIFVSVRGAVCPHCGYPLTAALERRPPLPVWKPDGIAPPGSRVAS